MYLNEKDPAKKEAMKKALKKQASMMEPEPFSSTESKTAEKPALSQTDGKGNKVEIKISESKGGGFYVDKYVNGKKVGINNANTRESAEAKAKSMMEQHMADPDYKAEEKPAAGIPDFKGMESGDYDNKLRAEGWTTGGWEGNGTHASAIFKKGDRTIRVNEGQPGKITSVQEISKPATKLPAKPTRGMSESYIRGTQLMKPAEDESQRGEQHWAGVLSGYDNTSVIEQRKQLQEKYDEFEEDIKDYDRRGLAPAVYAKRINQQNFIKGALKAIDDEMENRGMNPAPRTSVPDAAPRILTGDTRIRVRKA